MAAILEVNQLSKTYRNKRGIRQVSLSLKQGDVYGLLGPNGSGKTTLLKTITGLIKANQGSITVFGESMVDHKASILRRVGCVIDSADFYDYVTACQYLSLIARYYPELTKQDIEHVLMTVELNAYADDKVKHFSTGMKQRLAIAAAILPNPELIILDEPTNGLDVEGLVWFRKLVRKMAAEKNITFILSSHMIHELEQLCNCVGIIYHGELVKEGEVAELVDENQTLEQYYLDQLNQVKRGMEMDANHSDRLAK